MRKLLFVTLLMSQWAFGTAAVSGKLTLPDGTAPTAGSFAQFDLKNCGGNFPEVSGASITNRKTFTLASDGTWSGALYRNDEISCNGGFSTWWTLSYWVKQAQVGPARDFICSQASCVFDGTSAGLTPLTVYPPLPSPIPVSGSVLTNPLGPQTITGQGLTLTASVPLASAGTNSFTGSNTFGPLGNVSIKNVSADATLYVSTLGSDANDGLSWGTAKATLSGAYSALPTCAPPALPTMAGAVTATCGVIQVGAGSYSLSSTLSEVGMYVKIVGAGKDATIINCTVAGACISINNSSKWYGLPTSFENGLASLTLNGNGASGQIALLTTDALGLKLSSVRFAHFNGTNNVGLELLADIAGSGCTNVNPCYVERTDFTDVFFDDCTIETLLQTSGATAGDSFGHNFWRHMQWSLNNGQTALSIQGFAQMYSSEISGVINSYPPGTNTYTGIALGANAILRGILNVAIDNAGGGTLTSTSGTTSTNFNVWGFDLTNSSVFSNQDSPVVINSTASSNVTASVTYERSGVIKHQFYIDASNCWGDWNGTQESFTLCTGAGASLTMAGSSSGATVLIPSAAASGSLFLPAPAVSDTLVGKATTDTLTNKTLSAATLTGLTNGTGLQFFTTSTTCTTGAAVGANCTTASITLPVGYSDTNYRLSCTGTSPTNVPIVETYSKSNTTFTLTIAALTAAAASFAAFDCIVGHN